VCAVGVYCTECRQVITVVFRAFVSHVSEDIREDNETAAKG